MTDIVLILCFAVLLLVIFVPKKKPVTKSKQAPTFYPPVEGSLFAVYNETDHWGIDFLCFQSCPVYAPIEGVVILNTERNCIDIYGINQHCVRLYGVTPTIQLPKEVLPGQIIGIQKSNANASNKINNIIRLEVLVADNKVSPFQFYPEKTFHINYVNNERSN